MKALVKRALNGLGFDVIRYQPPVGRGFPVLPYIVRERLHPDFFFVQIGANDGIHGDPLHELIVRYDLAGILVEPLPTFFEQLRTNYASRTKLQFENVALASEEGTLPLYRVRPTTRGAPRWWFDIASFDARLLGGHGIPADAIEAVAVRTTTFEALLVKHRVDHVDLLQVDTEGYDGVIVRAALASGLRPGIINYESCHLPPEERHQLKQVLATNDYRFIDIDRDTLAVRPEA